jgi:inner membrane protein
METNSLKQEISHWTNSLTFKLGLIFIVSLLLLIPLAMIENIIREREMTANSVESSISSQWGDSQTLIGPILNIPLETSYVNANGQTETERTWIHIMPSILNINSSIDPQIKHRGIYETAVYNSTNQIEGTFELSPKPHDSKTIIDWEKAFLTMGVSDNRGIRGDVGILWDEASLEPQSGLMSTDISSSGFSIATPLTEPSGKMTKKFAIKLNLSGSQSLSMIPLGQNTQIAMTSTWADPSFTGTLLPQTSKISEKGFEAKWTITHLNRNFPQQWTGSRFNVNDHTLGVSLYMPVNHYQKSLRSAKYGILFISLTMLVFLFIELTKKKKIHLFHYVLVGLALVLFFSVLTALSEQIGFNAAYLIASLAIICLITYYTFGILKDKKQTYWIGGLLVVLYSFMFVLLQLNDYAFLAGNIGLLIVLAVIMKASLKLPEKQDI